MRKKQKLNLFLPILLAVSLAFISINTSHLYLFLSRNQTSEGSTISVIDTPKLSWGIEWSNDGKPICTESSNQEQPQTCSDGGGGAIITWRDYRSGSSYDIYAQLISSSGVMKGIVDGVEICKESNTQDRPQICSDGGGGAIITWHDYRSGSNNDIYAQRINSNGVVEWTANGVKISTASSAQIYPQICSDGGGGAIITWYDYRSGSSYDIYAQRVDSNGIVQWTPNGVKICTESGQQTDPQICSDGGGGAIITWADCRDADTDIYAQRINSNGIVQWTTNGVTICITSGEQFKAQICSDGGGGAIITWKDYRSSNFDVYAQRVNSNGVVQWTTNGVVICTASGPQGEPQIYSDGGGSAIITWYDNRGADTDIYAQRVNSNGVVLWTANGTAICTASGNQLEPQICSDGGGGAIITWKDYRSSNYDIYTQRVNSNGVVQWTANGTTICTESSIQEKPQICSDGGGGAIIMWQDYRSSNYDIYAQRIKNSVPTSNDPADITTSINGTETINWTLCDDSGGDQYRVLANDTNGVLYTWVGWTTWTNNTPFSVSINRTTPGVYGYSIEYYDDQRTYGVSDKVIVTIESTIESKKISFGYYFLPFSFIGLIFIIISWRRKINHK
jgi:phosphosulfolactate phosphohydrolase-like enzyme